MMIHFTKAHYATLRESVTATNYQTQELLKGLTDKMSPGVGAVPHLAAIKQITQITMREAEVMTFNNLFEGIAVIFLVSLAVAPFLKKMDKKS